MKTSVLAVDVGYGNTKFAYRGADDSIATGMFPSLSPYTAPRSVAASGTANFKTRDVTHVRINGTDYEVGPDVSLTAAYGNTGRALTDDYPTTSNYAALLAGAIYRSGYNHIERLVLGLPVHTLDKYSRELRDRFTGEHDFGQGIVQIDRVAVVPQPIGSLTYAAALRNGAPSPTKQDNLVIDVGYFTTDWVYVTNYMIDDRRSGGRPGGASQILQRIAEMIGKDEGEQVYDIERIDSCLRHGSKFHFYDKEIDLLPYLDDAQQLIHAVTLDIKNRVGPLEGIRAIVLSGGGAELYAASLQTTFPRTPIELLANPCFANAIGFLLAGESAPTEH